MTLQDIQTSSGKFTIASFDQRASLAKILAVNAMTDAGRQTLEEIKTVFMEIFSPVSSAVLVDPDYGLLSLGHKKGNPGLLLTLEAYDYASPSPEETPQLKAEWGVDEIADYGAAVKLFFYYNPESPEAERKQQLVYDLFKKVKARDVPFLIEPILYPQKDKEDVFTRSWFDLHIQLVKDFTGLCDVLKLEYPIPPEEELDEKLGAKRCLTISELSTVPWVMLSRGMTYERYLDALGTAMKNGASGIAVGRAVWQEIDVIPSREEQYSFIRTVGRERMLRLIDVVESA